MVLIQLWMGIIEPGEDKQLLSAGLPSFRYGTESHAAARGQQVYRSGPFSFFLSFFPCRIVCFFLSFPAELSALQMQRVASKRSEIFPPSPTTPSCFQKENI
jgi:hypothetical protein